MESTIPSWELLGRLGDEDVVVVDVRGDEEARRLPLQVPGTLRMTVEDIQESPHSLPDDELIVLVDHEAGFTARRAWRLLQLAGRTAIVLQGGMRAWLSDGCPTEKLGSRRRSKVAQVAAEPGDSEDGELDELAALATPTSH